MAIHVVGDAKADFDHWKEARKGYLTSSQMFTWRGVGIPDWWEDTRQTIVDQKFHGADAEFGLEAYVSMCHGTFDEENIMRKFGKAVGSKVEPCNKLFVNDKWPHLAASIDGYVYEPLADHDLTLVQDGLHLIEIRDDMGTIMSKGEAILCEIKKSTSTKWQTTVPEYYIPQLQTQMHICEIDAAIIVAETVKRGVTQKWRQFWDLRPYLVLRNPAWVSKLDEANKEFKEVKDLYENK